MSVARALRALALGGVCWAWAARGEAVPLPIEVRAHTLANGLRVVLSPDRSSPTVAVAVYYDVGSRDEERGSSGFAHLFEHMMFEGSARAPKGTFDLLMDQSGNQDANGTTSEDRTNYYETLPASALSVGLWLEADRMRALSVTPESFENQREVVLEERRQSYENAPYGMAALRRDALAYGDFYAYAHTAIGEPEDLRRATFEQVRAFHQRYYVPNNAVLSIAGDLDPDATLALVRRHFESIPRGADPVRPPQAPLAPRNAPRVETMQDALAPLPGFWVVHSIPPRRHPDTYALELLAKILADGESSRLYRSLVREGELAASVEVDADIRRGPGLFALWTVVAEGRAAADALTAQDDGIARVIREGVTEAELESAKNRLRADTLFGLESNAARARALAEHWMYDGDPALLRTELDRYLAVSLADVQRVARAWLDPARRVVLHVTPPPPSVAPPAPRTPRTPRAARPGAAR
jgi:zinc protease